jgi:predicted phage-related endonuclease
VRIEHHGLSPIFGDIQAAFPENEQEWLDFRRDYLSASEFGAAAGVSKFETVQDVIAKKKSGLRTPTSHAMQLGHDLEPKVAVLAAEKWGWEIAKVDYFLFSPSHKVGASLDYIVKLEDGIWCPLEIKTTSERNLKYGWLAGIPKHYHYQLDLQIALFSNDPRGKICVFTKDSKRLIVRDSVVTANRIAHLRDVSVRFWEKFNK